jgi:DNA-binding PadR family transcriptional regulator
MAIRAMTTAEAINIASKHVASLAGHTFDALTITKPISADAAVELSRIISKLSPILGNMMEIGIAEHLNGKAEFSSHGHWKRQDPGFPDVVLAGEVAPQPGLEIKAWYPLATEITARFKDSQTRFTEDNIYVAMLAWVPEALLHGKPCIIDVCITDGMSVARARDTHYHNPPDYLVLEPGDTKARTRNLQQTNTNGLKFQGSAAKLEEAKKIVATWGPEGKVYRPTEEYQKQLRELRSRFEYRLDTNYAKMDRIVHLDIEAFKTRLDATVVCGLTVAQWKRLLDFEHDNPIKQAQKEEALKAALAAHIDITGVAVATHV